MPIFAPIDGISEPRTFSNWQLAIFMDGKVIGVGFQKTGTSSLREALKILGYRVKDTTPKALIPILKGDYPRVLKLIEGYDALEDTPWYYIYQELDAHIPGSKFILTIRDEASWYKSVARHIGDLRAAHHEWIYGRGKGLPKDDEANTRRVYSTHNREVIEYFKDRPDDLLVLDFTQGDGWEQLCPFLGLEIPDVPFPHYNKTAGKKPQKRGLLKRFKFFRKRVKNATKIWYIDWRGYW
ncbi:sulfotransferase [Pontibacter sp. G13]|uniref:sulfotransferase family protein n=1 Tax=Pontibacter sp. G13 TaxID=3074898 RepID=UPI00288A4018|nr:sulfotransferase [Pontibacter sp. G13]WNJ18383.1 sulfotransferase [Pontibacter sp. G13]